VSYAQEATGMEKVHVIMGGFHLGGPLFEPIIGRTTEELQKINPDYIIPTHCTGRKAVAFMETTFKERFILNMSGTKLTFI
jgi:7,8-dihydropterin-6-yl-methyl-4-(beta-D-ribofuranosyl)aminobenzene 5'-phosphate synthase